MSTNLPPRILLWIEFCVYVFFLLVSWRMTQLQGTSDFWDCVWYVLCGRGTLYYIYYLLVYGSIHGMALSGHACKLSSHTQLCLYTCCGWVIWRWSYSDGALEEDIRPLHQLLPLIGQPCIQRPRQKEGVINYREERNRLNKSAPQRTHTNIFATQGKPFEQTLN